MWLLLLLVLFLKGDVFFLVVYLYVFEGDVFFIVVCAPVAESKLTTFWDLVLDDKKPLFTTEKFLAQANDEGVCVAHILTHTHTEAYTHRHTHTHTHTHTDTHSKGKQSDTSNLSICFSCVCTSQETCMKIEREREGWRGMEKASKQE